MNTILQSLWRCLYALCWRSHDRRQQQAATAQLAQNGVNVSMTDQAGGNMKGKETRFGIATSSTWAAFTTAASNASVNSMHDTVFILLTPT